MEKKINVLSLFDGISCGQIAVDVIVHIFQGLKD